MNIIILHGTLGSPDSNWFQWLKKELETQGHHIYVPRLPTPDGQNVKGWHRALAEQAPQPDRNTILIGHSCGATYLLHILERLTTPVAQSIFVSGFIDEIGNTEYDKLNKSFIKHNFNWNKIILNAGKINILHGNNDPYVPLTLAQNLAVYLKTQLTIIPDGGHLNSESGYSSFPQLLNLINNQ